MQTYTTRVSVLALILAAPAAFAQTEPTAGEQSVVTSILISAMPYILSAVGAAAVWALAALGRKLSVDAGTSKGKFVLFRLAAIAEATVADLNVTMKPLIAKASEDGKITPAEAKELRDAALERIKQTLGDKGMKELQVVLGATGGSIGIFIGGIIEKAVDSMKATKALAKPAVVVAAPQGLIAGAGEVVIRELVNKTSVDVGAPRVAPVP